MHEGGRVKTFIRLPLVKFIVYCTHNLAMTSSNKIFVPFIPKFFLNALVQTKTQAKAVLRTPSNI